MKKEILENRQEDGLQKSIKTQILKQSMLNFGIKKNKNTMKIVLNYKTISINNEVIYMYKKNHYYMNMAA